MRWPALRRQLCRIIDWPMIDPPRTTRRPAHRSAGPRTLDHERQGVSSAVYDRPMARWMPAIIGASWLVGVPLQAHHAISTFYDTSRRVTIEAIVRELHFVNPHPFAVSDVRSRDGVTEQWRLEMDNRRELVEIGFTHQTLRPGDTIVVAGSPARHEARSLYVRRIDRPSDGFWYEQVGTTPRIRPQ
jgi:uncharacterized protein DUF6152